MQAPEETESASGRTSRPPAHGKGWLVTGVIIGIAALLCIGLWLGLSKRTVKEVAVEEKKATSSTVELGNAIPELQIAIASSKTPESTFSVAGTVEPNQQQLQQISPLVSGRVESIFVALGDYVKPGTLLVRIDSPQVAELHGKLHEAETRVQLATVNLNRVHQSANRVSQLKAKATLDEAESTLKRTKQLVSDGLSARKDLVAAQSEYDRAMADYNFQRDISLNREVTEAKAELKTAQTEAEHIRDGLKALDAHMPVSGEGSEHDISKIQLHSPIAGTVIERFVNAGSGFEQGKPLLTIANTSTLWVIANVPESKMGNIHIGSPAKVVLGGQSTSGKVSYIDPRLNEDTRTSRVRIEIANPTNRIQVGSFAQIEFVTGSPSSRAAVYVPEASVQTVEGKPVVFVRNNSGQYDVRKVETGPASAGLVPIYRGLAAGEKVAATGSFILKSKLLKEQFGDDD